MKTRNITALALSIAALLTFPLKADELGESLNRRYDQNTYLAAHNAFANSDSHFRKDTANQVYDIKTQLDDGVRCLLLDVYLMRQTVKNYLMEFETYDKRGETEPGSDFEDAGLEVVLAHEPHKWGYELFDDYLFYNRPFENIYGMLLNLKEWMDANPNEVVTLVFESYVHESSAMFDYFQAAGLFDELFFADRPNPGMPGPDGMAWNVPVHGWPRLRDMVKSGKRLVVFSSNGVLWSRYSGQPIGGPSTTEDDGLPNYWSSVVENVYGDSSVLGDVGKTRSASEPLDNVLFPLTSMNWFPDANIVGPDQGGDNFPDLYIWNFGHLNGYDGMTSGRRTFVNHAGRFPNFINVDFYHKGKDDGPSHVVRDANRYWANRPGVAASIDVTPDANQFGWRKSATITAKGYAAGAGNVVRWINYYWHGGHDILGHSEETGSVELFRTSTVSIAPTNGTGGIDGVFRISAEALNQVRDRSDRSVRIVRVDSTPPLVAPAITRPPDGEDDWYTNSVTIGVRILDLLSGARRVGSTNLAGVAVLSENYDSSVTNQFIERTFNFPYTQEGQAYVHFYAEDFAGNLSRPDGGFILVKIDRTPPVSTVSLASGAPGSTILQLDAYDALSGIDHTWYQLDDETDWTVYTGPLTVSQAEPHTLRFYSRDVAGNVETTHSFYVNQVAIGLSSSRNPAGFFQELLLAATVTSPGIKPTGTVTFYDGVIAMSTVPVGTDGTAQLELSPINYTLPRGIRELTARYNGDSRYSPATSQILQQEVVDAPGVRLTSSARRIVQTQPLELNATVDGRDGLVPTGNVRFRVLNSASGREMLAFTRPLDAAGHASVVTDQLPYGILWLFADYEGDTMFPPGSSGGALEVFVDLAQTFVSVTTSPNPSRFGEPVTFTIDVSNTPGATPFTSGGVRIEESDTALETLPLDDSGHATWTTSALNEGNHFFIFTASTVPRLSGGVTSINHTVLPVLVTNSPPILASIADQEVRAGQLLILSPVSDDLDLPPQTLTYSLVEGSPVDAVIDPATGVFQWTPGSEQAGSSYDFTILLRDNGEPPLSVTTSFRVTVRNAGPGITTQPADVTQVVAGTALFNVSASGEALTYQWKFNGSDLLNETNSKLTLSNIRLENSGDYSVQVSNSDGSVLSSTAHLTVELAPVDLGLVQDSIINASIAKLLAFNARYSSTPLTLENVSPTSNGNGSIITSGSLLTYTSPPGYVGPDMFTYTVLNGSGIHAEGKVLVSVVSSNAPSLTLISITASESNRVVQFAGIPGRGYVLQFGPTAAGPWADLSPAIAADATGLIEFVDSTAPVPPVRFYRVRAVSTNP